jgi:hypothetical protein
MHWKVLRPPFGHWLSAEQRCADAAVGPRHKAADSRTVASNHVRLLPAKVIFAW